MQISNRKTDSKQTSLFKLLKVYLTRKNFRAACIDVGRSNIIRKRLVDNFHSEEFMPKDS